jgi:hypothetical protein
MIFDNLADSNGEVRLYQLLAQINDLTTEKNRTETVVQNQARQITELKALQDGIMKDSAFIPSVKPIANSELRSSREFGTQAEPINYPTSDLAQFVKNLQEVVKRQESQIEQLQNQLTYETESYESKIQQLTQLQAANSKLKHDLEAEQKISALLSGI